MKKHLLSFIGSLCGIAVIFFLNTPMYSYTYSNENNSTEVKISDYLFGTDSLNLAFMLTLLAAIVSLITIIVGIVEKKNKNGIVLSLSSVGFIFIIYTKMSLDKFSDNYNFEYNMEAGTLIIFILISLFFILSLINFIISMLEEKKIKEQESFDKIYKYQKLYVDGILTKEEFQSFKERYIK